MGGGAYACCPAGCGQCGGFGCEAKAGGAEQCCGYGLVADNLSCATEDSVACIVHAPASSDDAPAATNDVGFAAAKAAAAGPAAPFSGRRWGREEPGWSPDAIPAHDEPAPGAAAVAPRPARRAYDGDDVSTIKEAVWQPPVVAAPVAVTPVAVTPVAVTPAVAVGRTPPETE